MIRPPAYGGWTWAHPKRKLTLERRTLRIGEVSKTTGLSVRMIRYYESHGWIKSTRTSSPQALRGRVPLAQTILRRLYEALADAGVDSSELRANLTKMSSVVRSLL
jgi:hypothetical protein